MKSFLLAFFFITLCVGSLPAQQKNDFVVTDRVLVQRCVLSNSPSSRMIAVGKPGGFNYGFDALRAAPVFSWQGQFIDFQAETNARGGGVTKVLGIPQPLGTDEVPFRVADPGTMPQALRFHGYRRSTEDGDPTFLFEVDGVEIEQEVLSIAENVVSLRFSLGGNENVDCFYRFDPKKLQAIEPGAGLLLSPDGVVTFPKSTEKAEITLHLEPAGRKFVRKVKKQTGADVFKLYCVACHSTDGSKLIGPGFKDFWGQNQTVTRNGKVEQVVIDEEYVRESILKPQAAIVIGYEAVPMADFSPILTKEQIDLLVDYLSGL